MASIDPILTDVESWDDDTFVPPLPRMTEEEFEAWAFAQEGIRAEWVDGEVIIMSPVTREDDSLRNWLSRLLGDFVEEHNLGEVRGPEFMVRLAKQRRRRVPDILFIQAARRHLVHRTYLEGGPDLSIEVVSEDSRVRDWQEKFVEYEKAGVGEYWIVDPLSTRVEAYRLGKNRKFERVDEQGGAIVSTVVSGFALKTAWLWDEPRPSFLSVLRELGVIPSE
jgi:Uma2 family endonuclease